VPIVLSCGQDGALLPSCSRRFFQGDRPATEHHCLPAKAWPRLVRFSNRSRYFRDQPEGVDGITSPRLSSHARWLSTGRRCSAPIDAGGRRRLAVNGRSAGFQILGSPGPATPPGGGGAGPRPGPNSGSPMVSSIGAYKVRRRLGNRLRIIELGVVARDGIEPSTRGFSVRRSPRFGAGKPKTGNAFSSPRPNRPARPSPSRTGTPKSRPNPALS